MAAYTDRRYEDVRREVNDIVNASVPILGNRCMVVLDVDETILTTSHINPIVKSDIFRVHNRGQCRSIPEMVQLYFDIKRMGCSIAFITARRERSRRVTTENLHRYLGDAILSDYLILKPDSFRGDNQQYKTQARKELVDMGYTIVANIGDQVTDLVGGYCQSVFKLPSTY
uniref:Acid phosphatase n=1 Tax=viral metagenome TaxID=1070528 RepID=A0A6C0BL92_9ZZZZ